MATCEHYALGLSFAVKVDELFTGYCILKEDVTAWADPETICTVIKNASGCSLILVCAVYDIRLQLLGLSFRDVRSRFNQNEAFTPKDDNLKTYLGPLCSHGCCEKQRL